MKKQSYDLAPGPSQYQRKEGKGETKKIRRAESVESMIKMTEVKKPPTFFGVFGDDQQNIEKAIQHFINEREIAKEFTTAIAQRAKVG